ncbi:hypothetical protein ABZW11_39875 [Nonomuraea sp. NPDC004580]|uniref:hypothetical protein n=1 Tax=Nonomuraea sp. NPDC004580 TaxID=3154552 RepID=UPI0033A58459
MARIGRPAGLVLLALGPVLAAAYAGAGHLGVRAAVRAQIADPKWEGGTIDDSGMTSTGTDAWQMILLTALLAGLVALAYLVIGLLLRRPRRGRTALLVVSGVLVLPYTLAFAVALINPARALAGLTGQSGFVAGLPGWQSYAAYLILLGGLAQSAGMVMAAADGRRAAAAKKSQESPQSSAAQAGS